MWIWNHPNWPNYSYDASDFTERVEVFYRTAERIAGQVEALSSSNQKKVGKGRINLNGFLDYFTQAVNKAQEITRAEVAFVLDKTRFYDSHGEQLNERQAKVIARIFEEGRAGFKGGLSARNYVSIAKCSPATATRDLAKLRAMGALVSHGQGRGTRYKIAYPEPQQTSAWFYTRRAGHTPRS